MVFQNYNLFKNKTALENIMEPLVATKKMNKNEAIEKAEELLKVVGLYDKKLNYPSTYQGDSSRE